MIEINGLTKIFEGYKAVNELVLTVDKGSVFGFIGPNGAGKTTTIRMLTTLTRPSRGTAKVCGHDVIRNPKKVKESIGFMPDFFGLYGDLKATEYLEFFAAAHNIPYKERKRVVNDVLELTDLVYKKDSFVDKLSRGMQQRLSLARTLLHNPDVLILDEPASGLDPRARIEIRELLRELKDMGKTIFLSSHILTDLGKLCDTFGILEKGRLVMQGNLQDISKELGGIRAFEIRVNGDPSLAVRKMTQLPFVNKAETIRGSIHFETTVEVNDASEVLRDLVSLGIPITYFGEKEMDLEEIFMNATHGIVS